MKARSILSVFACVSLFAVSFLAVAGTKQPFQYNENGERQQPAPVKQEKSQSLGEIKLKYNQHIVAYLPKDIRSHQNRGFGCDESGQHMTNDNANGCLDYVSASTNTKWRVRFGQAGAAEKIFKLGAKDAPMQYVEFAKGDISKVLYASAEASKYAAANGSGETQVARENSTPTHAPPQQQAKADCGHLNFLQRAACEAGNNAGLGAAIGAGVRALGK